MIAYIAVNSAWNETPEPKRNECADYMRRSLLDIDSQASGL